MPSPAVRVLEVSPQEYFRDETGWSDLLNDSGADPLFLSYAWQRSWWESFGDLHGLAPCFLEARNQDRTVGRLALVRRRARIRGMRVHSLELMGNLWNGPATLRSELLDVVATKAWDSAVARAFINHLESDCGWGQIIFQDVAEHGALLAAAIENGISGAYVRQSGADWTREVPVGLHFTDYLGRLSGSTRRRLFGQRRRLAARGRLELVDSSADDESALRDLERLHERRFGSALLTGGRARFFAQLANGLPSGAMRISALRCGGHVVSALLNVRLGQVEYNIQGGFDDSFCRGVSPAKLHWGILIENAYSQGEQVTFDLLAGGGRTDDFKSEFAVLGRSLVTIQAVRHPCLATAYRVRDAWRRGHPSVQ